LNKLKEIHSDEETTFVLPVSNAKIYRNENIEDFSFPISQKIYTWEYNKTLHRNSNVVFLKILTGGKSIDDLASESALRGLESHRERIDAFRRSFDQTNIEIDESNAHKLIPNFALVSYFQAKEKILKSNLSDIFQSGIDNYEFFVSLSEVVDDIEKHPIKTTTEFDSNTIRYDIFSSKTGRTGLRKDSFPILNLKKENRSCIKPNNDWFVEIDDNSAELRTFLGLADVKQPDIDIHTWNMENIFVNSESREECKKKIFSYLFGKNIQNSKLNRIYDKDRIKGEYWNGEQIKNPYGRIIEADEDHVISYVVQSTFADLFLRKVVQVFDILRDYKSRIAFFIHDSVVLDLEIEEKSVIIDLVRELKETPFGDMPVSVSAGKNFGNLTKLEL